MLKEVRKKYEEEKDELAAEAAEKFAAIEAANERRIENIKSQCRYFISQKDRELRTFVDEFNAFQAERDDVLREHRDELSALYSYCNQLTRFVEKLEKDDRRLRAIRRLGLQRVRVKALPESPIKKPDKKMLRNTSRFRLLRRNMLELDRFDVALREPGGERARSEYDDDLDEEYMPPNSIRDRLKAKKMRESERPASARVRKPESNSAPPPRRPRSANARSPTQRRPRIPSPTTVGGMDAEELRNMVELLRDEEAFGEKDDARMSETRKLEEALAQEKHKYRNLRIAFNAQRRALEKAREAGAVSAPPTRSSRPWTATSTASASTRFSAYNSAAAVRRYLGYNV